DLGERREMPNQTSKAGPGGLGQFRLPAATLGHPKVVLVAAALLGLGLDLFVRPLSWVGFALILLATTPWLLQAWTQRSATLARPASPPRPAGPAPEPASKPRPEQRIAPSRQPTAA